MTFSQVPVGAMFFRGRLWRKRSTRTAELLDQPGEGLWFYWGQNEIIDYIDAPATLT